MLSDWRLKLEATVEMRRDANRRMLAAIDAGNATAFVAASKLHKEAERIARSFRMVPS